MGKKYFFELLDECESQFKGIMVFGLTPRNQISAEIIPEESLTPYTEPDMEQVRREAYEDGYKTAKVQCNIQAEKDLREVGERHYQKGLSDAWEAARKICTNWVLPDSVLSKIFGMDKTIDDIMKENKASEAIEKIRAYEQEKEEINVGDEVITASGKAVVMGVGPVHFEYAYADGSSGYDEVKNVKKTGRNFPEIAEVLQKMREGQEQ